MMSPSALMEFTPQSAMPTDGVDSGDGLTMSDDDVPICMDSGNPVSSQAEKTGSQWPVGNEGSPSGCGILHEEDRLAPLGGAPFDLRRGQDRVPQRDEGLGNEALGVGGRPLVEHPVVPGPHAGQRQVPVGRLQELGAPETGELGEEELGLHAVFVHGHHPLVDVEGCGRHVVEAPGEEVFAVTRLTLAEPSGPRVALEGNRVEAPFPFPPFDAGAPRHHAWRGVPELRIDVVVERVRGFHHMIVHGDELHLGPQHGYPPFVR